MTKRGKDELYCLCDQLFSMKPTHSKQNSLDFKLSSSLNEAYAHRTEVLAKTYRKKTHPDDSSPLQLLHRPPSTLNRYPQPRESKKSSNKTGEQNKLSSRKSQTKLLNQKSIERLRSLYKPNEGTPGGLKVKLARVVAVLEVRPQGQTKDMLQQFYQAISSFQTLQQEWRRLDQYDEIDDLLKKLVDNFTLVVEEVAFRAHAFATESLARVEKQVGELQLKNDSLKALLFEYNKRFQLQLMETENKVYEEYEKNQWSTLILHQVRSQPFDIEHFVKHSKAFTKAVAHCQHQTVPSKNEKCKEEQDAQTVREIKKKKQGVSQKKSRSGKSTGGQEKQSILKTKNLSQFSHFS